MNPGPEQAEAGQTEAGQTEAGQAVYSRRTLRIYDLLVLPLSKALFKGVPS